MNENTPTETPNKWIPSPQVRKWLYGIVAAAGALGVIYGLVTPDQTDAWLNLAANILAIGGSGLALANTPRG